jgi:hypothetical protein
MRRRTAATPVVRWRGGRMRGTSGVGEKGGESAVQCTCTCRVEPVGPEVAAVHRRCALSVGCVGWHGHAQDIACGRERAVLLT